MNTQRKQKRAKSYTGACTWAVSLGEWFPNFEASCLLHLRRSAVQEELRSNNAATQLRITFTESVILVKGQWVGLFRTADECRCYQPEIFHLLFSSQYYLHIYRILRENINMYFNVMCKSHDNIPYIHCTCTEKRNKFAVMREHMIYFSI
jgi:hypothetical protein